MRKSDFSKVLTYYLSQFLPTQRNLSSNTIISYRDTFKQLLLYYKNELGINPEYITFNKINNNAIKDFLIWLEKIRGVSINTRNQRLAAIHSFYRYAQIEFPEMMFEFQKILAISYKKKQKTIINHLSQENVKLLLEQPNIETKKGRRDLVIMTTLYDTGARIKELIDLKACDVRLSKPATIILSGKGNKKRCVPIMDKTRDLLKNYMAEHYLLENRNQTQSLFYNSRNNAFTRPGISYILEKYFNSAKKLNDKILFPESINPHMMRHTKAFHLLEAGVNLIYIRDFLGHFNVTTTEVYLKADTEIKRKALEAVYMDVTPKDVPLWEEDTDLLNWLKNFCN